MSNIVIFYGSRIKFDELLPNEYRTLTDLVYENDTLLKVKMISNQHIVVEDDQQISFVLKQQDENVIFAIFAITGSIEK